MENLLALKREGGIKEGAMFIIALELGRADRREENTKQSACNRLK